MKRLFNKEFLFQLVSYFFVGGIAAIVEWLMFALFSNVCDLHYILSTALAFIFSTTTNWILGRVWTFKNSSSYKNRRGRELAFIFIVSAIGLGLNMLLMFLFVDVLGMNTDLLKVLCKIAATGIVFFWNFLIRKFVIYKQ
ncbi:MAG: GtrA family protein [Lachnospiraceae bacterium]|jgi:putative flippase GtrA